MIHDVLVIPLKQISDDRGKIMHMLRGDDPHFEKFGEIYFSMVYPGIVKGWHLHKIMTLNYTVVLGEIKLVLFDDRKDSPSYRKLMVLSLDGINNYHLVRIPPGIWNGFKGMGTQPSIVANCATIPHNPAEIIRVNPSDSDIPYDWSLA
jgi:dTDP-4-dehydrorhamnose 3,5-epimerase